MDGTSSVNKNKPKPIFSGFQSTEQRFNDNSVKEITPGPGTYDKPNSALQQAKPASKQNCVFGSTSKRFIGKGASDTLPGPGHYTVMDKPKPPVVPREKTMSKTTSSNLNQPS